MLAAPMGLETTLQATDTPRHVLVVDDSRAQRHVVSMHLNRWGYRVSEADSGQAALDLCRKQAFDIIISDWMMPGMTGIDFDKAAADLGAPEGFHVEAAIAIGKPGDKSVLPEGLRAREMPNDRKPLSDVAFEGSF